MKDAVWEQLLTEHGCEWEYRPAVRTNLIDHSEHSQSRFATNDEQVLIYAEAMVAGDEFPAVVLHTTGSARLSIIDGFHRIQAMDLADRQETDAYVVRKATDNQLTALLAAANAKHGLPPSLKERLAMAVLMVNKGATQEKASRITGVPEGQLTSAMGIERGRERLAQAGISTRSIPQSVMGRLSSIHSEPVLKAAGELVVQAKLTTPQVSELVTRVNRAKSEAEQLNVLEQHRKALAGVIASTAGGRIELPREVAKLSRLLDAMARLNVEPILNASLSAAHKAKLVRQMRAMIRNLKRVEATL